MKTGKLSENVWKRSVLKQIKTKRKEVMIGAGIGEDCAILSYGDKEQIAVTHTPVIGFTGYITDFSTIYYGAVKTANNLAAAGAEPVAVSISGFLPKEAEEKAVKMIVAQTERACEQLHIQLTGCDIRITGAVSCPVLTVSGTGRVIGKSSVSLKNIKPGQDIVAGKWIGLEGTSLMARGRTRELLTKYPVGFVEEAKEFDRFLSVIPEAATAIKSGVCAMHNVTEGGIFGALWEVAEGAGVGLEIDLKKIPVKQETIEICEFFEINPYELTSAGCLLMIAENGFDLVRNLAQQHIPATVIGKTTDSNDRIVINGEEHRFLEPAKGDELYKVMDEETLK